MVMRMRKEYFENKGVNSSFKKENSTSQRFKNDFNGLK